MTQVIKCDQCGNIEATNPKWSHRYKVTGNSSPSDNRGYRPDERHYCSIQCVQDWASGHVEAIEQRDREWAERRRKEALETLNQ